MNPTGFVLNHRSLRPHHNQSHGLRKVSRRRVEEPVVVSYG